MNSSTKTKKAGAPNCGILCAVFMYTSREEAAMERRTVHPNDDF